MTADVEDICDLELVSSQSESLESLFAGSESADHGDPTLLSVLLGLLHLDLVSLVLRVLHIDERGLSKLEEKLSSDW